MNAAQKVRTDTHQGLTGGGIGSGGVTVLGDLQRVQRIPL
jgi:hypothetical protein